jgi:hypothetical protein
LQREIEGKMPKLTGVRLPNGSAGNASSFVSGSLAANLLGFWRGGVCGKEGVLIGVLAWLRGQEIERNHEDFAVIVSETEMIWLRSSGRDDRWASRVGDRRRQGG